MDFNATIDLIVRELDEAREIIEDLKKFPGAPVLQIEMAKAKCKSAAEVIALLKNRQETNPSPENVQPSVEQAEEKIEKPSVKSEMKDVPVKSEMKDVPVKSEPDQQDIKPLKSKKQDHSGEKSHEITPDEKNAGEPQEKKPYIAPIIADTFSHLANRFNERLTGKQEDDFSYISKKKWTSLNEEIGINDRFYYIREIFNGSRDSYTEAVTRLEKAENLTESRTIIMSYRIDKIENEAVKQLLDLLRRKFVANE
jgi:hypothetical protein